VEAGAQVVPTAVDPWVVDPTAADQMAEVDE
jgi:hypothetical protein